MKPTEPRRPLWSRPKSIVVASIALIALVTWASFFASSKVAQWRALPKGLEAQYVGRSSCIACHPAQAESFKDSHHDKAMDIASEKTVLADFNDVVLEHLEVKAHMFRREGKFFVNTEGPEGEYQDFEVRYVFGVEPLQQYMVEFDRTEAMPSSELPKVQVLRWSWDTVNKKWFHLDPPDVATRLAPQDPLHWTGQAQRWNSMCADCHSTNLQKGFNTKENAFHTTFSEIDVSCETCHGPGSIHVQLANRWIGKKDPEYAYGLAKLKDSAENQIQACAPCHARRGLVASGFKAGDNYYDFFSESLLTTGIYFADGQVQDEDYIHGSFLQSKMYHKGIRCSDCHDPHSARLKHDGNQVCTSCHQHPKAKYDSVAHHFHKVDGPGAQCVNCHMPSTTYMAVDPRRDHSLRLPRPDLSLKLGTPNACTGCHIDSTKLPEEKRPKLTQYLDWLNAAQAGDEIVQEELTRVNRWCDEACDKWYGEKRFKEDHFASALTAARANSPEAVEKLTTWLGRKGSLSPAIARATMLEEFARVSLEKAIRLARNIDAEDHPMVRRSAVIVLSQIPEPGIRAQSIAKYLEDPSRSVRVEAARAIASCGPAGVGVVSRAKLDTAINELGLSMMASSEQSGSHLGLGILDEQLGRYASARTHYEDAIRIEPNAAGPRTNLAALLEGMADRSAQGGSSESKRAESELRERAIKLRSEELPLLERDAGLLPDSAELQHRYGLALYLSNQTDKALEQLRKTVKLAPERIEYRMTLVLLLQKVGKLEEARMEGKKMLEISPANPEVQAILQSL